MDFNDASSWVFAPLQILFVDLLLGADNALVIALACRALPPTQVRQAAAIGVVGAMVLRLLLAIVATSLLTLPLVKIAGAIALFFIAMNLAAGEDLAPEMESKTSRVTSLASAAAIIIVADLAMSLDNVVALAAIANGNFWWIAIGVAMSLPILGFVGVMLAELLRRAPFLVELGAALLGWIAGGMALTDPLVFAWADANAPALVAFAPALGAAFVFFYGRFVAPQDKREKAELPKWTPLPAPKRPMSPPKPLVAQTAKLEAHSDDAPEPVDIHEPDRAPKTNEDRIAIIGLLVLAVIAGTFLMVVSYFDSFN